MDLVSEEGITELSQIYKRKHADIALPWGSDVSPEEEKKFKCGECEVPNKINWRQNYLVQQGDATYEERMAAVTKDTNHVTSFIESNPEYFNNTLFFGIRDAFFAEHPQYARAPEGDIKKAFEGTDDVYFHDLQNLLPIDGRPLTRTADSTQEAFLDMIFLLGLRHNFRYLGYKHETVSSFDSEFEHPHLNITVYYIDRSSDEEDVIAIEISTHGNFLEEEIEIKESTMRSINGDDPDAIAIKKHYFEQYR